MPPPPPHTMSVNLGASEMARANAAQLAKIPKAGRLSINIY